MRHILKAWIPLAGQFVRFGLVGVVGFGVDAGVLKAARAWLGFGPYDGRIVSFLAAATVTWLCNRHFTFRGLGDGPAHRQWARFLAVSAGGFAFNYGTYAVLIETVPLVAASPTLGVAAGSLAGMFFNFFAARKVVFR